MNSSVQQVECKVDPDVLFRTLERERASRKRAEQLLENKSRELFAAQQELQQQYDSLKSTQAQLVQSEKMASLGQLAAGVAHEINNPVGFVNSNLGTLAEYVSVWEELFQEYEKLAASIRDSNAEQQAICLQEIARRRDDEDIPYLFEDADQLLSESVDGLRRVREIVQNLKSFVRLDQAEEQLASLNESLEVTLKVVWNELKYKCAVEKRFGDIPPILCLPGELNQVFSNILLNAAHAIEKTGVITITTDCDDDWVYVRITDDGVGIAPENLAKLFTPFFTTKPIGKGTGLGLSVSYGIIQKHRGDIQVQSELGFGTQFVIKLPNNYSKSAIIPAEPLHGDDDQ